MTTDSHFRIVAAHPAGEARLDARVRKVLRSVSRHLAALSRCYRTRDRTVLGDLPGFVDGRHLHTFTLDSRSVIQEMDALAADGVPMSVRTRELFAALRLYLADLEGVLIIEPPMFGLPPRQMDLRCIAFRPEVEAFGGRIEALIAAG